MELRAFIPTGNAVVISATTASTVNQLATAASQAESLRVTNETAVTSLVSISSSTTPDATADGKTLRVLAGTERIFNWPANANSVSVALSSGTGTVSLQLGRGF